jgi:hypothetical protein
MQTKHFTTPFELRDYIQSLENGTGEEFDLEHVDISKLNTLAGVFINTNKRYDVSSWNVSHIQRFDGCFMRSHFNEPLSSWDVSSAVSLKNMFAYNQAFNQPLDNWDISHCKDLSSTFCFSAFNQPLDAWDTQQVVNLNSTFEYAQYNQPLSTWDTRNVQNFERTFLGSDFNQPLPWDFRKGHKFQKMLAQTPFEHPLLYLNICPEIFKEPANLFLLLPENFNHFENLMTWKHFEEWVNANLDILIHQEKTAGQALFEAQRTLLGEQTQLGATKKNRNAL